MKWHRVPGFRRQKWQAAILLFFAACDAPAERPASAPANTERPSASDSADAPVVLVPLREYIARGAYAHGMTRAQLVARFGRPDSVTSTPVPNRHDPSVTDSVVTLDYPAARYVYYVVTQGPGEILDAAHIGDNVHMRHPSPGIGASPEEVLTAFGTPMRSSDDRIEYECTTCEVPEPVTFVLSNDRVARIEFDYYVD